MKGNRLCFPKIIALWHKDYFELIIFKKQQAQSGSCRIVRDENYDNYIYKGNLHLPAVSLSVPGRQGWLSIMKGHTVRPNKPKCWSSEQRRLSQAHVRRPGSNSKKLPWRFSAKQFSAGVRGGCRGVGARGTAFWILVPWPGIESAPPALEEYSFNHWATREVPSKAFLKARWGWDGGGGFTSCTVLWLADGEVTGRCHRG